VLRQVLAAAPGRVFRSEAELAAAAFITNRNQARGPIAELLAAGELMRPDGRQRGFVAGPALPPPADMGPPT
jgi:hypothetical protein